MKPNFSSTIFLILLTLFSIDAYAQTCVWNGSYPSAGSACSALAPQAAIGDYPVFVSSRVQVSPDGTSGSCWAKVKQAEYNSSTEIFIALSAECKNDPTPPPDPEPQNDGDKCDDQSGTNTPDDPMIYDSKAGKCMRFTEASESPSCKYMASKGSASGTAYQVAGTWDGGVPSAPPSFAQSGTSCEVSVVSSSDCVANIKGSVLCNVMGKLTGNVNNKTDVVDAKDAACDGSVCTPVKEETSVTDKPCVYSGSSGSVSCSSETETQKDGKQSCGTVNGKLTCVFSAPSSNGIKIDSSVKTTTNSDGGSTSVKTDNATKTTCTGINKCTQSTSSTTTTTKSNSAGQTTATDTKCTGSCGTSGTGIKPGGGSGTGTGTGTGSGSGDGEGDGDGASGLEDPEDGSFDEQNVEWDKKLADSKKELTDSLAKVRESFSPIGDIQLSGGGQLYCPPAVTVLGHSVDFCLSKYAGSLSWIASAFYALCAMVALMIVFV